MPHTERLITTETEDGYTLEGAQLTPLEPNAKGAVIVWMHGFTGRFYEAHTLAIGRQLAARGHTFITGNNRGHDLGANIHRADGTPGVRAGAWWEDVAECRFDFSAWLNVATHIQTDRVILAGHSLGAYKAVTYMGACQDQRVHALISASGPLRLWQRMRQDPQRLERAERMVADGRGDELLPADAGGRITSARTLVQRARFGLDPYGIDDPARAPLGQIRCPILFVLGSEEPEIGMKDDLPTLTRNARSAASAETAYIEGADHVYRGRELVVADAIAEWLARL